MRNKMSMFLLAMLFSMLGAITAITFVALGVFHFVPWLLLVVTIAVPIVSNRSERQKFLVWKDEYAGGFAAIDNDHKKLIDLINAFESAVRYQKGGFFEMQALSELKEYTASHFASEEKFMKEYKYPDFEAHKAQHNAMSKKVDSFLESYKTKDPDETIEEIAAYLKFWLVNHMTKSDRKVLEHIRNSG